MISVLLALTRLRMLRVNQYAVLLLATAGSVACAGEKEDQFRRDYPKRAAKLEEFYTTLEIHARRSFSNDAGGEPRRSDIIYFGGGNRFALVDESNSESEAAARRSANSIRVAAPQCSFMLRSQPDGTLAATDLRRDAAGYQKSVSTIRSGARFATAPYSFMNEPISEYLKGKSISVTKVADDVIDDRSVVKVHWKNTLKNGDLTGWFAFRPDNEWVLDSYVIEVREHQAKVPFPGRICGKLEYAQDSRFAFPTVAKAVFWTELPEAEGARSQIDEYTVTSTSLTPADTKVFDLSYYDLEPTARKRRGAYFWLATALVVSMMGAIGFRILAQRRGNRM